MSNTTYQVQVDLSKKNRKYSIMILTGGETAEFYSISTKLAKALVSSGMSEGS